MSFSRLFVVLLSLGLAESCACGRAPVTNTLKGEGEACAADEECESSLCDKLPGKANVCFRKCAAVCKAGDICTALANNDRFACVPEIPGLCQPCSLNVDCPYPGDRCLEIGGTKVCTRDCSFDGQCPTSYRCADGTDTNGAYVTKQCQPTSGTCACVASSAGQTMPCSETNTFGTCTGVRTCRPPNGYEACTAPVPTTESCNGRDDDCNGMTDENLGDTTCGTGECRRTVTNCINGSPQQCSALSPTTEICDGKDNDCDAIVDDGFDKMTSLTHCGACNALCIRAHATPVCMGGMCGIGQCDPGFINADGIDQNGCELMCTPTGAEVCDGADNDCDGLVDEGFTLASDVTNCGQCGRVCNVNNGNIATYACVASTCGIMNCTAGFADCDQSYGTGCEKNVSADVLNCGGCNTVCTTPNATPACVTSACAIGNCNAGYSDCDGQVATGCEIQTSQDVDHCGTCPNVCPPRANASRTCVAGGCGFTCNPGFVDLDGLAATGCEYTCTATGVDDPDDNSTDQNCDGIDGDESRAIFVAKSGNDSNPGTRALPKLTVQAGINAASSTRPHVYVSSGVYDEAVTLVNGVSVFGGYNAAANWARSGANVVTLRNTTAASGRIIAVSGTNITSPTKLAYLSIQSGSTTALGVSSYGLWCNNCDGLTLYTNSITGGSAGSGTNGTDGTTGTAGLTGSVGNNGSCDGSAGSGGAGGFSACSRTGGNGGAGGPEGNNSGSTGDTGLISTSGGTAGGRSGCGGAGWGGTGSTGTGGAAGTNGSGGSGGALVSGYFSSAAGASGLTGSPGNGGGGGGGGAGQGEGSWTEVCNDGGGNGGGGGGGGGCGGTSATGGGGGGSSFGVFLVGTSAGMRIENCTLTSGNGGNGGVGGAGGNGGGGGTGGQGASVCTSEVGRGGSGGPGGAGGRGGHGGGGAGGASYALYRSGSTPTLVNVNYSFGSGGLGGTAPGNVGANGASGSTF